MPAWTRRAPERTTAAAGRPHRRIVCPSRVRRSDAGLHLGVDQRHMASRPLGDGAGFGAMVVPDGTGMSSRQYSQVGPFAAEHEASPSAPGRKCGRRTAWRDPCRHSRRRQGRRCGEISVVTVRPDLFASSWPDAGLRRISRRRASPRCCSAHQQAAWCRKTIMIATGGQGRRDVAVQAEHLGAAACAARAGHQQRDHHRRRSWPRTRTKRA